MLCVPAGSVVVVQVALRVFPEPDSGLAEQPLIDAAPFVKLTVPVGAVPVTLAVNVMLAPAGAGFCELASAVDVGPGPPPPPVTSCINEELVEGELLASPV